MDMMNNLFKPVVDWLSYRSYKHNRMRNPHIPYYKWRRLYADALQFEEIFEENVERIEEGE